jgi:hypothetical protein
MVLGAGATVLLGRAAAKTQGYADLSSLVKGREKAAVNRLAPVKSALVKEKAAALSPLHSGLAQLKGDLAREKSAAKSVLKPKVAALSQEKSQLKGELGGARAAAKAGAKANLAPIRSSLVKSRLAQNLQADRSSVKRLASEAKSDLRAAGSSDRTAIKAATAGLGSPLARLGQEKSALRSGAKAAWAQDRTGLRQLLAPARSALVKDKSALGRELAPARSSITTDAKALKGRFDQGEKGVAQEAGKLEHEAVAQVKKRPKLWNLVKPAGSP